MSFHLADVLNKLDEARALTAEVQAEYRTERAKRQGIYSADALAHYIAVNPKRFLAIRRRHYAARRDATDWNNPEAIRFVTFLYANQIKCPHCFKLLNGKGTVDHMQPVSRGGQHEPNNLILLCRSCNSQKSDRPDWPPAYRFKFKPFRSLICDRM